MTQKNKLNILLGIHSYLPYYAKESTVANEFIGNHLSSLIDLIEHLNKLELIKATFHLSGDLIKSLDKQHANFSPTISSLLSKNQIELLSGGIYEPIFPFIPREDRQTQLLLMNRLLNHTYGYNPNGAWVTEFAWEPGITFDLAKSRILYTCLPKEYFMQAGLVEKEINGYYITEDEGRKLAIFPIAYELNDYIQKYTPKETLGIITNESNENSSRAIFYKGLITSAKELNWLQEFFTILNSNEEIKTHLLSDYYNSHKPSGRIYLSTLLNPYLNGKNKPWKQYLLKYPEINLLHKKMLRVSKKINSAKEGKSRFKVIKEMINQAHNLLLQGQFNCTYWDNTTNGIYLPGARHDTYSKLLKAENLIEAASMKSSRWVQISEIDYDCDGNDETIIETDTHNVYMSSMCGGTILEYDYKPKNINLTNAVPRREESYHKNGNGSNGHSETQNDNELYDFYPKANLIDHFLNTSFDLNSCIKNKLPHLTKEVIYPYSVEKIKAKEETCKIAFRTIAKLIKLDGAPEIELKKTISTRAGDPTLNFTYSLINTSSQHISFVFAIEFNIGFGELNDENSYFYIDGNPDNKTNSPLPSASEEINNIKQISLFNNQLDIALSYSWDKDANIVRYPITTLSYNLNQLTNTIQGITLLPYWKLTLEPNIHWELSIMQHTSSRTYDN